MRLHYKGQRVNAAYGVTAENHTRHSRTLIFTHCGKMQLLILIQAERSNRSA